LIRKYSALLLIALVYFCDRAIKAAVLLRLPVGDSVPVVPDVFHLTRVNNIGAAFGLFSGRLDFLIVVSVVCVVILGGRLALRARKGILPDAADYFSAMIAGGALGNLYDRSVYGFVVDYLDFRIWPVFNLADACITMGTLFLILGLASANKKKV
jgi:signal peptidase II